MVTLHLFIPGLLRAYAPAVAHLPKPVAPGFSRLLGQATVTVTDLPLDALLFESFKPQPDWDLTSDLPVAPLTRLAEGAAVEVVRPYHWLRADPVYLHADFRQVRLFDAHTLAIQPDEAKQLVSACNEFFSQEDMALEAPHPDRWYLRRSEPPDVFTWPLQAVIGQDITPHLPDGPARHRWHRWLTEVQMLLHNHPVNQARETRGQRPINGVWLWGGGRLPDTVQPPSDRVYAADPLARGLAQFAGIPFCPLPTTWTECQASALDKKSPPPTSPRRGEVGGGDYGHNLLIVLEDMRHTERLAEPARWNTQVEQLDQAWGVPLLNSMRRAELKALTLYPDDGRRYHLTAWQLWQFWRSAYRWP